MNFNLDYHGFEDYLERKHDEFGGVRYVFKFENGYGASVIKNEGSYGWKDDLWELAVLKRDKRGYYVLCYDTHITDNVLGYQTDSKIRDILKQIKKLP